MGYTNKDLNRVGGCLILEEYLDVFKDAKPRPHRVKLRAEFNGQRFHGTGMLYPDGLISLDRFDSGRERNNFILAFRECSIDNEAMLYRRLKALFTFFIYIYILFSCTFAFFGNHSNLLYVICEILIASLSWYIGYILLDKVDRL